VLAGRSSSAAFKATGAFTACLLRLFNRLGAPHQVAVGPPIYGPSYRSFSQSRFRRSKKLRARLIKYTHMLHGTSCQ